VIGKEIQALIRHRMEQAEEALGDAAALIERRSHRASVNRSYYAMFYAVLALLNLIGQGTSKHGGAIALFDREFVKSGIFDKQFSKWLHEVFMQRQKSDYDELIQISDAEASEAAMEARKFVEEVQRYLAEQVG